MRGAHLMLRGIFGLALLLCLLIPAVAPAEDAPMLPQVYQGQVDVSGWLMSEKLDGVRGRWDGRFLWSKNGVRLRPPPDFTRDFPPFALEGEIWGGRGTFERTAAIVQRDGDDGWLGLRYAVFDVPDSEGGFTARLARAQQWFAGHPSSFAFVVAQIPVKDRTHLQQELARVEKLGGEGLVVRRPEALYVSGRSPDILKVKSRQDAEAVVIAHIPGQGKYQGVLGALLVELADGTRFRIGTGFSDAERRHPPAVGTVITFSYQGIFTSGIPRFPSYVRIRADRGL